MKAWGHIAAAFVLVGATLWVFDALVDRYLFHQGDFLDVLLRPDGPDLFSRASTVVAFVLAGVLLTMGYRHRDFEQRKGEHVYRVLSSIRVVEQGIRRGGTRQELIQRVCGDLVSSGAYSTAWIALLDPSGRGHLAAEAGLGDKFAGVWRSIEAGNYTTCMKRVLAQSEVVLIDDCDHTCKDCPIAPAYRGACSLSMRLGGDGDVTGVLTVSLPDYLAHEVQERALFREVASDILSALRAVNVESQRRRAEMELDRVRTREAEVGFRIQQMLLFQRPPEDIRGASIAAITVPSQQVDGDFYDFFKHNDLCFDVIVADVMGKGTHAALLGAAAKGQFMRAVSQLVASSGWARLPEPRDIVTYVHREMTPRLIDLESFVTAVYMRFDLSRGRITFVDCGHSKPLLYQARNGTCQALEGYNLFLGAEVGEVYEQRSVAIAPGDMVLLYSDGIIESMNRDQELFGIRRLSEMVRKIGSTDPVKLIDRVMMDIIDFSGSDGPADDLTCVAVRIDKLEPSPPLGRVELEITSDPGELARARGFVLGLSRRLPIMLVDEQDISRLELAVNEAASNIMRHAYQGKTDQRIRLEADIYNDRLVIRLCHWGIPYAPDANRRSELIPADPGGFGLAIMSQCVDQVRYLEGPEGSHLVELTKIIARV